ncbi:hypothetical protein O1157_27800 [Streptomyces albogriseolus]
MVDVVHAGLRTYVTDYGAGVVGYEAAQAPAEPHRVELLGHVAHLHVAVLVHELLEGFHQQLIGQRVTVEIDLGENAER